MPGIIGQAQVPAWRRILNLATADGWTGLYDPTNPNTRTLRVDGADSYFSAIADGLGNLPDLVQATESKQMLLSVGAFGKLDAAMGNANLITSMATNAFADLAQPFFGIIIGKLTSALGANRKLVDGVSGTKRMLISTNGTSFLIYSGATLAGANEDNNSHVHGGFYNDMGSEFYIDGALSASGAAGTQSVSGFTIGTQFDLASSWWIGPIGPLLFYHGNPGTAKIGRMFDLLHSLTGIAQA
jgi:hypothetical protein